MLLSCRCSDGMFWQVSMGTATLGGAGDGMVFGNLRSVRESGPEYSGNSGNLGIFGFLCVGGGGSDDWRCSFSFSPLIVLPGGLPAVKCNLNDSDLGRGIRTLYPTEPSLPA